MSSENFFSGMFQPVVLNTSGQITVAAGYKAKFYAAGTDIPQTIYTDAALTVPYASPSNIAFLDDTGKALIYLGLGGYKLVLTDPNDTPVPGYTIDNIVGVGTFGTGFVNSFADLLNVNTNIFPYTYIGGYYTPGDGGEGMFYNKTSVTSADGGYVQDSDFDPTKKWFRIPDESGKVRAASFGYIGTDNSLQTSKLQAADNYAFANGATLLILAGTSAHIGDIAFTAPIVEFSTTSAIKAADAGTATVSFAGIVIAPAYPIFGSGVTVTLSGSQSDAIAEWFGATTGDGNNKPYFDKLWACGAGGFVINPGTWTVASSIPPINKRVLSFGILTNGVDTIIPRGEYYLNVGGQLNVTLGVSADGDITSGATISGQTVESTGDVNAGAALTGLTATVTNNITSTAGKIEATAGQVKAGTSVTAGTAVVAGTSMTAGTFIQSKAGTSVRSFRVSGILIGGAYNQDVVATPLSLTLPANTLVNNGDSIVIEAGGTSTALAGDNTFYLSLTGLGDVFNPITHAASAISAWSLRLVMMKTSSTTVSCDGYVITNGTPSGVGTTQADASGLSYTIDFTVDNAIALSAAASGTGTIVAKRYMFEYRPI
jgi:hypothetical protein